MKTAITELIDELKDYKKTTFSDKLVTDYWILKAEKMLEREKEQIIDAYENGSDHGMDVIEHGLDYFHGEEYYNEKYNQNK